MWLKTTSKGMQKTWNWWVYRCFLMVGIKTPLCEWIERKVMALLACFDPILLVYLFRLFNCLMKWSCSHWGLSYSFTCVWGCVEPVENIGYRFSKNRTKSTSKFKNRKLSFRSSVFTKPTSAVRGRFFTLSHSQFILQQDRINSQRIFLHAVSLHF